MDIMADILRVARGGAKKTWIVYKANLNFKIVRDYLAELKGKGLLSSQEDIGFYRTTERGLEFLEQYDSFRRFQSLRMGTPYLSL